MRLQTRVLNFRLSTLWAHCCTIILPSKRSPWWRRLEDFLKTSFVSSSEDVFKTFQDVLIKTNIFALLYVFRENATAELKNIALYNLITSRLWKLYYVVMYSFAIMKYFVSCRRIRHKEVFLYFFIPLFINYFDTIALLNAVRIRFLVHKKLCHNYVIFWFIVQFCIMKRLRYKYWLRYSLAFS